MLLRQAAMSTGHIDHEFVQLAIKHLKVYFNLTEQEPAMLFGWHATMGSIYRNSDGTIKLFPCTRVGLSEGSRLWGALFFLANNADVFKNRRVLVAFTSALVRKERRPQTDLYGSSNRRTCGQCSRCPAPVLTRARGKRWAAESRLVLHEF